MRKDGELFCYAHSGKWHYTINGKTSDKEFGTKIEAAKAFVEDYKVRNPKYAEMFKGKTWRQIFAMLQMKDVA